MKPIYFSSLVTLAFFILNVAVLRWILFASKKKEASVQAAGLDAPPMETPGSSERVLKASDILEWEFHYARTTASEAMKDRHTMINFYLIVTGVVVTGVLSLLSTTHGILDPAIGTVLLWVLCLIGWLYFLNVVRLREAWCDSARAMNRIKEFYFQYTDQLSPGTLRSAFHWRSDTLPPAAKKWTVSFFSAAVVGLLNSVAFVTGGMLLDLQAVEASVWVPIILVLLGLAYFAFHIWMYFALLASPAKGESVLSTPPNVPSRGAKPEKPAERTSHNCEEGD